MYIMNLVDKIKQFGNCEAFNIYINIDIDDILENIEKINYYYVSSQFKKIIINHINNIIKCSNILFVKFHHHYNNTFKIILIKHCDYLE